MSYVVLARKWRPRTFADLTGQEHIARTLTNAIVQDRVPHAMLFTGARGVGKTTTARIVAMALNCESGPTPSPCGTCSSCLEIQKSQSVDVLEIDGASNRGINEIRELRESVRYAPQQGRSKVYIIDEVHMLTTEAFNALLKTLEEPPPQVAFIFATTEVQKIPVTILSRCQRFDFRYILHQAIVDRLAHISSSEELRIPEEVLSLVARQAGGSMRDALSLLDQLIAFSRDDLTVSTAAEILGAADRRQLFDMSDAVLRGDVDAALTSLHVVLNHGLDTAHFASEFVAHLRDLAVVSVSARPEEITQLSDGELAEAREQTEGTSTDVLQRAFELMVPQAEAIQRSPWPRLLFEMALVRLCALEDLQPIDSLITRLEALSEGREPPPTPSNAPPSATGTNGKRATKSSAVAGTDMSGGTAAHGASSRPSSPSGTDSSSRPTSPSGADSSSKPTSPSGVTAKASDEVPSVHSSDTLTFDLWRKAVTELPSNGHSQERMLARASVVFPSPGKIQVAMKRELLDRIPDTTFDSLKLILSGYVQRPIEIELAGRDELDQAELADSRQIAEAEEQERQAQRDELNKRMRAEPALELCRKYWPTCEIDTNPRIQDP